jgi:pyruvate,water dikinase
MGTVIPVDEFISDEWYPGFKPGYLHAPWYVDPVQTFRKEDEEQFWFLDFHWPRGLTPMGLIWNEDGYNWASQLAAEQMPLPPGRGITCRLGGTHTYGSALPVNDPREIGQRAVRLEHNLPPFLQNFEQIWGRMREEVNESWDYFRGVDLSALSLADLRENLVQARQYHKRAFEIHFQVMYPLLANYVGFYGMCTELGLDPGQIGKFLQGYDTKIMETDRELWRPRRPGSSRCSRRTRRPGSARRWPATAGPPARGSPSSTTSCRSTAGAPKARATSRCPAGSRTRPRPSG